MTVFPTSTSSDEAARGATVAVLPVGSFEQHGQYLPLATDTIIASIIARELSRQYNLFLLPAIPIACSHEHAGFAGTVSISDTTLSAAITDIYESLHHQGIKRLAIVNAHGGNYALANTVQKANITGPRMTLFPLKDDWQQARDAAGLESSMHEDMHGGEIETSILLHAAPEVVRDGNASADHVANNRQFLLVTGMKTLTTSGIIGRPSLGTPDKGKLIVESLTQSFAKHLEVLAS